EPTNPGQFNEKNYYLFENIDYKMKADEIIITDYNYSVIKNILYQFKERLINVYLSILPDKEAGTIIAMILGEKYLLDDDVNDLYKKNGISHILSISGLHVSLIGMFIYKLLKKLNLTFNVVIIISIGFLYSYGILTNFSVSTIRAIIMMALMLVGGIFGKTYDMISSISLSALLILLANPFQLFQAGFLLSYGAVIGIAVLVPAFGKLFPTKSSTINGFFVSVSAQLMTAPLILNFFYQLPLHSVFINMIIIPLSSGLMLTSLIAGLIGLLSPGLGVLTVGGASYILKFYQWVCTWGKDLPANTLTVGIPNKMSIIVYVILILIFIWSINKYCKKSFILILPIAFLLLIFPVRYKGLEITMLNVGQGEAIYIRNDTGTTYLIDGGSSDVKDVGKYRIAPFLISKGIDHIDYAIVTHEDSDHTSGLMELIIIGDIKVNNLILPQIKEKGERYLLLESLAKDNHIPIKYISQWDYIKDDKLLLNCLHPPKDYDYSDANSYSTVLSLSYGELDMLLTGDLDDNGEKKIVELIKETPDIKSDYDILKVAH
ncbi:MAG: DNA internalization-related competence protein ComEC/Rec2, partial [Clostridiales bacterium]|nr:DNA internalization-related competence protein ComEC/Rec2 [Clostridiales bacterium]